MDIDSATTAAVIAASGLALDAGHRAGDYWVQTDWQARTKGKCGSEGRMACLTHVITYVLTQAICLYGVLAVIEPEGLSLFAPLLALLVSGATHYMADRREHGLMFWVARKLGKSGFMSLGVPRVGRTVTAHGAGWRDEEIPLDNPSLGTGAWALDQAWHIVLGVFVPALIIGSFV